MASPPLVMRALGDCGSHMCDPYGAGGLVIRAPADCGSHMCDPYGAGALVMRARI